MIGGMIWCKHKQGHIDLSKSKVFKLLKQKKSGSFHKRALYRTDFASRVVQSYTSRIYWPIIRLCVLHL